MPWLWSGQFQFWTSGSTGIVIFLGVVLSTVGPRKEDRLAPDEFTQQRQNLLQNIEKELNLTQGQMVQVRAIFGNSTLLGQGNPALTVHPMTRDECHAVRKIFNVVSGNVAVCGAPNMVPIYNPNAGETVANAKVCIDQFEFPNIACEYPVVYVAAYEAVRLCEAVGKRICDAHEWEGSCAGAVRKPEEEYTWKQSRFMMMLTHNAKREYVWAYGATKDHGKCATKSKKNSDCYGSWHKCGSNTYPAGSFPQCVSSFGVYDLHGNAAEHMNFPMRADELASDPSHKYGHTEMKGSWFIFSSFEAHEDDCRWRALDWHGSRITDVKSHSNYHLGFRCCKDITPQ